MPDRARWAAVVVNYEAGTLLDGVRRSVLADTSAGPVELVVVDNGSRDGSVAALQRAHPDVQVVRVARQRRVRARGEPRDRGDRAPSRRGAERRHAARAGHARVRSSAARRARRGSRRSGRA